MHLINGVIIFSLLFIVFLAILELIAYRRAINKKKPKPRHLRVIK